MLGLRPVHVSELASAVVRDAMGGKAADAMLEEVDSLLVEVLGLLRSLDGYKYSPYDGSRLVDIRNRVESVVGRNIEV